MSDTAQKNSQASPPGGQSWLGLTEGGEMGGRIRAFDWSRTSLGPVTQWPESLRTSLRLCLSSRFPMNVWWGPDLINFYNDAFIPVLGGRHPASLGQPAASIWSEAWSVLAPQTEAVMQRGESTWNERTHVVVTRNGFPEEAWFTWSYSPIRDDAGRIAGLLGLCLEETARVLAEKSRERLADEQLRQVADASARTILESITEAFFAVDREWRFIYLNPQSFVLLGRPPAELIGKNLWAEYPGVYDTPFGAVYSGVMETRKANSIVAYYPDHQRWYDLRAYPSEDGGVSVYFRDVSQQKRADEEKEKLWESERAARSEAERAGRLKDEFLATLSHELRTPLNAVLGWCEILNRTGVSSPEELADGLATIERNARAQAQIIADILDMSSIIAGKMRVVFRPVDLAAIMRHAIDTARPTAEAKGIQLKVTLDASVSRIAGDPNRLQQIFWNLLSNAVKFTPKDGRVTVQLRRIDSDLVVSVADTGMGIKPDFLPFVFDRFRQADASTTRQHGGLGLGLSIVKQLVELHGGTIRVESDGDGRGATFTVSLPVAAMESFNEPASEQLGERRHSLTHPLPEGSVRGVKVVVVDDEPDARKLVKRLLEDFGATVTAVSSAQEAFESVQRERPDVLVSDVSMPREDGYSLIRRIRSLAPEQGGETPAVALTAYARAEDRDRSILAGFQMHIAKPVEPLELVLTVATLAAKPKDSDNDLVGAAAVLPAEKSPGDPLRILLVEDHQATREVLTRLLGRRGHVVIAAGSLAKARAAAENEKFDLVISDLGLPDGSGITLMTELRDRFGLKGIALSGFGEADDFSRTEEAGFVTHLIKPVSIGALQAALAAATTAPRKL